MSRMRLGYFRMPPVVRPHDAVLIFIPAFARCLSAVELAMWGQENGYGDIAYVPARVITEERLDAAS